MSQSNNGPIIVIGRQFGSGGRKIGKILAEKLGIGYYDTELLSEAAKRLGISSGIFDAVDEKRPSPLHSLLQSMYGIADNFHSTSMCGEKLYSEQSRVIREICAMGPCVIVGRTADYVMREHPGLVSVFLHSPIEKRISRIVKRGEAPDTRQARELAERKDRERENYYNYFTGHKWGNADNYHLTINAAEMEDEAIADLIISYIRYSGK